MPTFTITTVCLPKATPADRLAGTAAAALAAHGLTSAGPSGHFLTTTRLRKSHLLQPCQNTAAGGPIKLLDLKAMRQHAHLTHWNLWHLWNQIVHGSPSAKPHWHFYDRHLAEPKRYPLAHAQQAYLAQTRIARMTMYNARPDRLALLPTGHIEALETGPDAYATYGWLSAVPGNTMITVNGQLLHSASGRLADRMAYLQQANAHLNSMAATDHLVAIATR